MHRYNDDSHILRNGRLYILRPFVEFSFCVCKQLKSDTNAGRYIFAYRALPTSPPFHEPCSQPRALPTELQGNIYHKTYKLHKEQIFPSPRFLNTNLKSEGRGILTLSNLSSNLSKLYPKIRKSQTWSWFTLFNLPSRKERHAKGGQVRIFERAANRQPQPDAADFYSR